MSTFGLIEYNDAKPEVKAVYDDIIATRKTDYINNFWKAIAHDPVLLKNTWESLKAIMAPGALDPLTRDALGDDYRALHERLGLTTVMITHDMTEAILLADRIAVMRGGRLLAEGTPAALSKTSDAYVSELLSTPRRQTERLNARLPRETT